MDLHWCAKHNLIQRQGRAGRTHSGVCFRICSKWRFDQLPDNTPPEITRTPLHQCALMVKWLRLGEISAFLNEALDPPEQTAISRAIQVRTVFFYAISVRSTGGTIGVGGTFCFCGFHREEHTHGTTTWGMYNHTGCTFYGWVWCCKPKLFFPAVILLTRGSKKIDEFF